MVKRLGVVWLIGLSTLHGVGVLPPDFPVDREHLILMESKVDHMSCISILVDGITNKKYLVKQKRAELTEDRRVLKAIRKQLGCAIPNSADLPSQQVWVIPADVSFVGKFYDNLIATLHVIVPGVMIQNCPAWKHLNIRQRREGDLGLGITKVVIKSMAEHPDLAGIVAFDTATGNCSRHQKNYFFEGKSNHFYMIDMGGCYKRGQVAGSCRSVENMLNDHGLRFTEKELRGLIVYCAALQRTQKVYPREVTTENLHTFIAQSHLPAVVAEHVFHSITKCAHPSYDSFDKLIHLLQLLIEEKKHSHKFAQVSEL